MSLDENKALFRRFIEQVANKGDLSVIHEMMPPDFIENQELPAGAPQGRDGVEQFFREWRQGFTDRNVTLDLEVAEGDLVTTFQTWRGTHTGEFLGIPATGKTVKVTGVDIVRVADGMLVEHWGILDMLLLMQQLGVIPTE
jgi:steroid delta-isomerase-like uncharacterized protein